MTAFDFNVMPVETIADLKGRMDIVDFVGRYAKLKQSGHGTAGNRVALPRLHRARTEVEQLFQLVQA